MKLPTWTYKDGVFNTPNPRLVSNPKEVLLALEDGYWSHRHKKEDIPGLFKAEIKQAEIESEQENVLIRFTEVKKSEPVQNDELDKYKSETGKDAIWDKGPHKGKPTKEFKTWRKNGLQ